MRKLLSFMLLGVILTASACDEKASSNFDHCGDVKSAIYPIANGVDHHDATIVDLNPNQIRAIGALSMDMSGSCSATIVAPNVVLTAAHCVENARSQVLFFVGPNYASPELTFHGVSWQMHPDFPGTMGGYGQPQYDIAVVILEEDATAHGIEPIPVHFGTETPLGETVQAVGYGMTSGSGGYNTRRLWTTMPCSSQTPLYYELNGEGRTGICSGDSGGPMLWTVPGQGIRVMGVVSGGDSWNCMGRTYYPRTSAYEPFLTGYVDLGPCEGETLMGRCDGDTAIWCEADTIVTDDCAARSLVCGADIEGNRRCVEPPPPCLDETLAGRCDGETAIWCEDDSILYHDCGSFGWYCGRDAEGYYRCVEDSCRGETFAGRCMGYTAVWCEDGSVLFHDCPSFGWECGLDEDGNHRCVPPGTSTECDRLGHDGECVVVDGQEIARWCSGGTIRERNCTVCEQRCGWTGAARGFYCYDR